MPIPLPSKKIVIFGVGVLVLTIGVLWYLGGRATPNGKSGSGFEDIPSSLNNTQLTRLLASTTSLEEFNPAEPDPVYTQKDLNLVGSSSTTVATYASEIKKSLSAFSVARPYEAQSLILAVENHDAKAVEELVYAQKIHRELIAALKKMPVPQDAAPAHLQLLNQSAKLEFLLRTMVKVFEAPVAALQSGREFIDEAPAFFIATRAINQYFDQRGFQFEKQNAISIYVNVTE